MASPMIGENNSRTRLSLSPMLIKILFCFVVAIVLPTIGAFVFRALELDTEREEMRLNTEFREKLVVLSGIDIVTNTSITYAEFVSQPVGGKWGETTRAELFYEALERLSELQIHDETDDVYWDFTGSFFFCITVFTTIGYGRVVPKTSGGRAMTVVYGFFGVALTAVAARIIGGWCVRGFTRLMLRVADKIRQKRHERQLKNVVNTVEKQGSDSSLLSSFSYERKFRSRAELTASFVLVLFFLFLVPVVLDYYEGWGYANSVYFAFVSLSTIGFGDLYPTNTEAKLVKALGCVWLYIGVSVIARAMHLVGKSMTDWTRLKKPKSDDEDSGNHDAQNLVGFDPGRHAMSRRLSLQDSFSEMSHISQNGQQKVARQHDFVDELLAASNSNHQPSNNSHSKIEIVAMAGSTPAATCPMDDILGQTSHFVVMMTQWLDFVVAH